MSAIRGVTFQADLPLVWRATEALAEEVILEWLHSNAILLRALATMEAPPGERDIESTAENDKRLERLEAKLDLTLDLLTKLMARDTPKPPSCPVTVSAAAIEWTSVAAQACGTGVITLFIDPRLPQPLQLPALVAHSTLTDDGHKTMAEFLHLDEETREWLERAVFRRHRRHIQAVRGKKVD